MIIISYHIINLLVPPLRNKRPWVHYIHTKQYKTVMAHGLCNCRKLHNTTTTEQFYQYSLSLLTKPELRYGQMEFEGGSGGSAMTFADYVHVCATKDKEKAR